MLEITEIVLENYYNARLKKICWFSVNRVCFFEGFVEEAPQRQLVFTLKQLLRESLTNKR